MTFYTRLSFEKQGVLINFRDQKEANQIMQGIAKVYKKKLMDCMPYKLAQEQNKLTGKEKQNCEFIQL